MNHAIILAAGQGGRMKSEMDKLLLVVATKPLIYHVLAAFNDHPDIDSIILVANWSNKLSFEKIAEQYHFPKIRKIILGAQTRQRSFEKGFSALPKSMGRNDVIVSHNADNPLVTAEEISAVIDRAAVDGACIVGNCIGSTLKEINAGNILKTHDRKKFFMAETPQAARYDLLKKALENSTKKGLVATDEAMLLEAIGQKVVCLRAGEHNFKITTPSDYARLRAVVGDVPEDFRVGIGQDSHLFEDLTVNVRGKNIASQGLKSSTGTVSKIRTGHKSVKAEPFFKNCLTLAGLKIPDHPKLKANSDGDVILHAIFNALSQAAGDMSLGFYADPACEKGVTDSKKYLQIILKKIYRQKFRINSLGLMLECKNPRIDPLVGRMKKSLSGLLSLATSRIGITATGGENLTMFGAGLGIQCFAIVSLIKV